MEIRVNITSGNGLLPDGTIYLNWCRVLISEVLWYSTERNSTVRAWAVILQNECKDYTFNINATSNRTENTPKPKVVMMPNNLSHFMAAAEGLVQSDTTNLASWRLPEHRWLSWCLLLAPSVPEIASRKNNDATRADKVSCMTILGYHWKKTSDVFVAINVSLSESKLLWERFIRLFWLHNGTLCTSQIDSWWKTISP